MTAMFRVREHPTDPTRTVLRPFAGGDDLPFNTRWRDVEIGVTKPTAANTGVLPGVARGSRDIGAFEVTTATVIENMDLTGRILARGPLTLRNCKIDLGSQTGNAVEAYRNFPVELIDCTITATGTPDVSNQGVAGSNIRMVRCDVSRVVDTVGVTASTYDGGDPAGDTLTELLACYFHDLAYISPDPNHTGGGTEGSDNATHNDGVQISNGANLIVRGCRIDGTLFETVNSGGHGPNDPPYGPYGQGVTLTPLLAPVTDALIEQNWFDYGKSGITGTGFPYDIVRAVVRDNRFGPNFTAWDTGDGQTVTRPIDLRAGDDWTGLPATNGAPDATNGNVWEADNTPVPVYRRSA